MTILPSMRTRTPSLDWVAISQRPGWSKLMKPRMRAPTMSALSLVRTVPAPLW